MDETLIHSEFGNTKQLPPHDFFINVGAGIQVYERPYLKEFLKAVRKKFEIVLFTAAEQEYADAVLDHIDPNYYIDHRLYRDSTCQARGVNFVKDLNLLGRDLSRCILVDNSLSSMVSSPDNCIQIRDFYFDKDDEELKFLAATLLHVLAGVDDVRPTLKTSFRIAEAIEAQLFQENSKKSTNIVENPSLENLVENLAVQVENLGVVATESDFLAEFFSQEEEGKPSSSASSVFSHFSVEDLSPALSKALSNSSSCLNSLSSSGFSSFTNSIRSNTSDSEFSREPVSKSESKSQSESSNSQSQANSSLNFLFAPPSPSPPQPKSSLSINFLAPPSPQQPKKPPSPRAASILHNESWSTITSTTTTATPTPTPLKVTVYTAATTSSTSGSTSTTTSSTFQSGPIKIKALPTPPPVPPPPVDVLEVGINIQFILPSAPPHATPPTSLPHSTTSSKSSTRQSSSKSKSISCSTSS